MNKTSAKPANQSTARALSVLECVAGSDIPIGTNDVARSVGIDRATACRMLQTLKVTGYLLQDETTMKFRLGFKILELSYRMLNQNDLRKTAASVMDRLAADTGETINLGILDAGEVLYIDGRESSQSMRISSRVGKRNPAYCTSLGKAMLACLSDEKALEIICASGMQRITGRTIISVECFRRELARIRNDGYAVDDREHNENTICVAGAIRSASGELAGAIT